MNKKPIYTITTVRLALGAGVRCVGYYHNYSDAELAVIENDLDINEMGYYPYAVIEQVTPGIYTVPRPEFWYQWNGETEKYESCPKPERFAKVAGWGIG